MCNAGNSCCHLLTWSQEKRAKEKKIKLVAQAHNNRLHDYGMHIYTYELVLFLTPSCRGARLCGECDISSLNPVDTSVRAGFGGGAWIIHPQACYLVSSADFQNIRALRLDVIATRGTPACTTSLMRPAFNSVKVI